MKTPVPLHPDGHPGGHPDGHSDGRGPRSAAETERLYQELRQVARGLMSRERTAHTLEPTALVHEAWMRLGLDEGAMAELDDGRALRLAARAMRHVLVDHARSRLRLKRGDGAGRVELDAALAWYEDRNLDLLALDDALAKLEQRNEHLARIVELRFFAGATIESTALLLETSTATVERSWRTARLWLARELDPDG